MQKKLAIRLAVGLLSIALAFAGFLWFREFIKDPDLGDFDSTDLVLALEQTREGGRAILLPTNSGDNISPPRTDKDGFRDTEAVWSLDGNRIFLSSNRKSQSFSVHRWNPEKESIEIKRDTSRSQSAPWFGPEQSQDAKTLGLILSGGFVLEYNVRTGATSQILPPLTKERMLESSEGGASSPMDSIYGQLGQSFRKAAWNADKNAVYAVMNNEFGQVAIINGLSTNDQISPPREVIRGVKVEIDVNKSGTAVAVVRQLRFREGIEFPEDQLDEEGRPIKPFENGIIIVQTEIATDPEGNEQIVPKTIPITLSQDIDIMFANPAVSPDGTKLAVVAGQFDPASGDFSPEGVFIMPIEQGGGSRPTPLVRGNISDPSWSPQGTKLTYIKRENGNANVYIIDADGSSEKKISSDGTFEKPTFSPQCDF